MLPRFEVWTGEVEAGVRRELQMPQNSFTPGTDQMLGDQVSQPPGDRELLKRP